MVLVAKKQEVEKWAWGTTVLEPDPWGRSWGGPARERERLFTVLRGMQSLNIKWSQFLFMLKHSGLMYHVQVAAKVQVEM